MKKKTAKRVLTLLPALVLCLGLLPMAALADTVNVAANNPAKASDPPDGSNSVITNVSAGEVITKRDDGTRDPAAGPFWLTFLASGGKFSDGDEVLSLQTTGGPDEGVMHRVQFPSEEPVREGYSFTGWVLQGVPHEPAPQYVTADAVFEATWDSSPNGFRLVLDPNGGSLPAGTEEVVYLDDGNVLRQALPVPTRSGYTFLGWYRQYYSEPVKTGDTFTDYQTPLTAKWSKIRASKITPSLTASPSGIESGAEKIELTIRCATSGVVMDWRPLERVVAPAQGSGLEAAAKGLLSGNFSAVGLKLTGILYEDSMAVNENAYPRELYPQGVCPASGLTLTLEGKAKAGALTIQLSGKNFLESVPPGSSAVLDAASDQIFNDAQIRIPVGSPNPEGPFTVKFDLNYKDPPKAEIPEDQKVARGATVSLPDGTKLTSPYTSHEFYAWCMKGEDGKLYPWTPSAAVTADMTLYAGWVRKSAVVKDGEAVPDSSAGSEPAKPEEPVKTGFSDVAPTSPFAEAISWAVEQGITNGKTADTFGPGDPCTRAQIVTFLWRAAGSPEPKLTQTQYMDVTNAGAYFYKPVQWAAELDMEYSGTFDPGSTCTRADAVYFIWKANGSPQAGSTANFTDMPEEPPNGGQWYWPDLLDAVSWAVGQGVTNGTGDGTTFSPGDPCTRGQIVTFLYRAYAK